MLRAEPLYRVQLLVLASEIQDAALALARFGVFNPAPCTLEALDEVPALAYRDTWHEADSRLSKLLEQCSVSVPLAVPEHAEAPALADLQELNEWLRQGWNACLECHENELKLAEARARVEMLGETLATLGRLNVDIAQLLRPDSLLAVEIGSLAAGSVRRVSDALSMTDHLLSRFDQAGEQVFVVVAGPRSRHDEARAVLAQAGWHELRVPEELRVEPSAAQAWLEVERERLQQRDYAARQVMNDLRERLGPRLQEARLRLALARPLAEAASVAVRGKRHLAGLSGWIPKRRADALKALLDTHFHGRAWLDLQDVSPRDRNTLPSLVRYPRWLQPFVPLVKSYGIPRYGEFDPALPFAFTYLLLFGAMFGDVGHGAVIVLASLALLRRLGHAAWIGVAAGTISMLFGVLYGSVFGYEQFIEPLWLSPLHDPIRVLTIAVAFGVGFIAFTLLAHAYNKVMAGELAAALLDAGGLAGLAFYLGAVGVLASVAGALDLLQPAGALAVVGIVGVAAYKWAEARAAIGERVLVTFIETLETGINLFSNTLSFMRVAAFSLNHVALALAVFTLAQGLDPAGYGLTVVLGNVVIIVLEGAIVAIQALRLMYYEGFSRFFSGDGREFVPLRLTVQPPMG